MATGIELDHDGNRAIEKVSVGKINRVRTRRSQGKLKAVVTAMWANDANYEDIVESVNSEFGLEGPYAITTGSVSRIVSKQLEYWRDRAADSIDEKVALTLMRFNQVEELASEAFFQSKRGKRTETYLKKINQVKNKSQADKIKTAMEIERLGQSSMFGADDQLKQAILITAEEIREGVTQEDTGPGDPRWLKLMMDANKERANLWNLYKFSSTVTGDSEYAKMTDEARTERIATLIAQVKNRAIGTANTALTVASPLGGFKEGEEPSPELRGIVPKEFSQPPVNDEESLSEVTADDFDWD